MIIVVCEDCNVVCEVMTGFQYCPICGKTYSYPYEGGSTFNAGSL